MSNWFTLATWPLTANTEVTWKHFEDIRRAIFILYSCSIPASHFPEEPSTWSPPTGGYMGGEVVKWGGMWWVSDFDGNTTEPSKTNWGKWLPVADSQKYYHYCQNSHYYLGNMRCGHTGGEDGWYAPHAALRLPSQVWPLTNCIHFSEWQSGHEYKVGDKVRVQDRAFERDGMQCGFICIKKHTSSSDSESPYKKPTTYFPTPIVSEYWRLYGDPVEVSSEEFISKNSGVMYPYEGGSGLHQAYSVASGWPMSTNELHGDEKYQEYQSAVERIVDGSGFLHTTDCEYEWDSGSAGKPEYDSAADWRYNCNKSAFELALRELNIFNWYWDAECQPKNWVYSTYYHDWFVQPCEYCAYHGQSGENTKGHGVWRRGWRYGMDNSRGWLSAGVISESHNGTCPASSSHGTDSQAAQVTLNHTQNLWHGNPSKEVLNDMKAVLDFYDKKSWTIQIAWQSKIAYGHATNWDCQPREHLGSSSNIYNAYKDLGGFFDDAESDARGEYANLDWGTTWVNSNYATMSIYMQAAGHYFWDRVSNPPDSHWEIYPMQGIADCEFNAVRLRLRIPDPPRNANAGGRIQGYSVGLDRAPSVDHYVNGAYAYYYVTSYVDYTVESSFGTVELPTTHAAEDTVAFNLPPLAMSGGDVIVTFVPNAPFPQPSPGMPSCSGHNATYHGFDYSCEWTVFAGGNIWVVPSRFYYTITKTFSIF